MPYLIYFFIFLSGLIIGSFLNALIYRMEIGKSVFHGRSFCPKCKHILAWYDLVPLFSFIALGGKCRYCHKKISIQYPLVEIATGLLFISVFYHVIASAVPLCGISEAIPLLRDCFVTLDKLGFLAMTTSVYYFYIISVLIVIFVYDLKHYIIPDKIILPAIVVSFIWNLIFRIYLEFGFWNLEIRSFIPLFAALGASLFFFSLIALSKGKWIGFGDVKLAFLMGLVLGYPQIAVALFTAVTAGAIIGVCLIIINKKNLKSQIPFGPFLVGGTIFSLFLGEIAFNWYWSVLM